MSDRDRQIEFLKDNIARRTALLDQFQATLDTNRHRFSEDRAWEIQATIDLRRFDLEFDRLSLKALLPK